MCTQFVLFATGNQVVHVVYILYVIYVDKVDNFKIVSFKVIFDLPGKGYMGDYDYCYHHGYEYKEEDRTSVQYRRYKLTVTWCLSKPTINLNLKITGEMFSFSFTQGEFPEQKVEAW